MHFSPIKSNFYSSPSCFNFLLSPALLLERRNTNSAPSPLINWNCAAAVLPQTIATKTSKLPRTHPHTAPHQCPPSSAIPVFFPYSHARPLSTASQAMAQYLKGPYLERVKRKVPCPIIVKTTKEMAITATNSAVTFLTPLTTSTINLSASFFLLFTSYQPHKDNNGIAIDIYIEIDNNGDQYDDSGGTFSHITSSFLI